jgi:hypothetical protein
MDENKKLIERVQELEKQLEFFQKDSTLRGFYALNRIVNVQIDYLNEFNLKSTIGTNSKEDKEYDRAEKIWNGLDKLILSLDNLKKTLNVSGDEKRDNIEDKKFIPRVSPESIAHVLGNTAGKQD